MGKKQGKSKSPATPEAIFKVMMTLTFVVGGVFFLKNALGKNLMGALTVGLSLMVFGVCVIVMRKLKTEMKKQQLLLSVGLVILVFLISMNSGSYYSDDFPLFLAVISLSGLYLEPSYTIWQAVLINILMVILYVMHPEKAESLSQYIMCLGILDVAAGVMYLLIKRGRAFIEIGNQRAEEAEALLESMNHVSEQLQNNCDKSTQRINGMQEISDALEGNVEELKRGSLEITRGTKEVDASCADVREHMKVTADHIEALNVEVKKVEAVIEENKGNLKNMDADMGQVKKEVGTISQVLGDLQQQMHQIAEVTEQLTGISTSTKMLALNASIEAARAGASGAGFAVVASKVQDLAVDSSNCSDRVVAIVESIEERIEVTVHQMEESFRAIEDSIASLDGLQKGFDGLIAQFKSLYGNIEEQNTNVKKVDDIFGELNNLVSGMNAYAEENQAAVEAIVSATTSYRDYVDMIIDDTKQINDLSSSMLDVVKSE